MALAVAILMSSCLVGLCHRHRVQTIVDLACEDVSSYDQCDGLTKMKCPAVCKALEPKSAARQAIQVAAFCDRVKSYADCQGWMKEKCKDKCDALMPESEMAIPSQNRTGAQGGSKRRGNGALTRVQEAVAPEISSNVESAEADAQIAGNWGLTGWDRESPIRAVREIRKVWRVTKDGQDMVLKRVDLTVHGLDFARETQVMQELGGAHRTLEIVSKVTIGQWGYMLLPLVPHPDLLDYVKAALFLGWDEESIWRIFASTAAAEMSDSIMYMHSLGLGHGDLKLDNILVSELATKDVPSDTQRVSPPLPRKLLREAGKLGSGAGAKDGLTAAIEDLRNGRVPLHFTLFDFGESRPLETTLALGPEKCCPPKRGDVTEGEVDRHMWTMSALQLRHPTAQDGRKDIYNQMKTLNQRYFHGDTNKATFENLLLMLSSGASVNVDKLLYPLASGTEAQESFKEILENIQEA